MAIALLLLYPKGEVTLLWQNSLMHLQRLRIHKLITCI